MTKDDLKEYLNKGLAASKGAIDKAGKAVSKFGDESILKIEIQQLKSQIKKDKASIGELVCKAFLEDGADSFSAGDEAVVKILDSIRQAQADIKDREERLAADKG